VGATKASPVDTLKHPSYPERPMWPSPRPVEEWSILDHLDLWVSSWMVLLGLMVAGGLAGLASGGAGGAQATALLRIGEVYKPAEEPEQIVTRVGSRPFLEALVRAHPDQLGSNPDAVRVTAAVASPRLLRLEADAPNPEMAKAVVELTAARLGRDHEAVLSYYRARAKARLVEIEELRTSMNALLVAKDDRVSLGKETTEPETLMERSNSLLTEQLSLGLRADPAIWGGTELLDAPSVQVGGGGFRRAAAGAAGGLGVGILLSYYLHHLRRRRPQTSSPREPVPSAPG
jgi:hypothetical protein